jgi:hypothetical protein
MIGAIFLLLTATASAPTRAPPAATMPAPVVDPAKMVLARQLITTLHSEQLIDHMMTELAPQVGKSIVGNMLTNPKSSAAIGTFISTHEGGRPRLEAILTEEFLKSVRQRYPALLDDVAREYANRFETDELRQVLAFYSSGVGAKALALMPLLQSTMSEKGRILGGLAGAEAVQKGLQRADKEMAETSGKKQ